MRNLTTFQFIVGCLIASAVIIGLAYIQTHQENKVQKTIIHGGEILK